MEKKHNILAVVTARGGSKGLPGKNIKVLGDKPLICYSVNAAKKSNLITHTIVSTDDKDIAETAKQHGGEVPFMRPKELARDDTPHLPVMQHAVSFMEEKEGTPFDYVVIFQPTSPFRTKEDVDGTIQKLIDTGADSAVSVCEVDGNVHPMKMKKFEGDTLIPYASKLEPDERTGVRRQELPTAYKRSSAVYAMRRDVLMKSDQLYGKHVVGYVVPAERSIDIDTPLDWLIAEHMLAELTQQGFTF